MTREELKKTREWQALNAIWKTMTKEQRHKILGEFKYLTQFINRNATPPVDCAAEDAAYQEALSTEAAAFARAREAEGHNLYAAFLRLIGGSTFESPDKVLFFFQLKYGARCPWLQEYPDEVAEILDLAWRRQVARGFVPGEGFPR